MIPSLSDYQSGSTQWIFKYKSVTFRVTHHGISEHKPQGIWCYYIYVKKEMFQKEEHFDLFNTTDYYMIPELPWHHGCTYGKRHSETILEFGCDYNHYWDEEHQDFYNLEYIKQEAILLIEDFISNFPQNLKCEWSGKIGKPEEFYKTVSGKFVHKNCHLNLKETNPYYSKIWAPRDGEIL